MERVEGLQCSFPVDPHVTNRSQPFVVAQIERAEAEEALRTPLRPSGLLAGAAGDADAIFAKRLPVQVCVGAEARTARMYLLLSFDGTVHRRSL